MTNVEISRHRRPSENIHYLLIPANERRTIMAFPIPGWLKTMLIGTAICLLSGCGTRKITFDSRPPGASIEMLATDAHTTTGVSSTPGSYQYNPTSPTGLSYQPGSVQNNSSTTYTQSRRIKGYTPLTLQWRDTDEPEDFVVIKKDKDWVVIYVVEKSASIQVDFEQDPIIVKGARLRDSSRRASQDSGQPTSGAASAPQQAVQPAPVAIVPVTPAPGLKTWQMAVNTNPPGAIIQAYDGNQELYQIGKSPAGFLWPLQTQADALVVIWQGRQVSLLPVFMESISVDFSQHPPVVKGGAVIDGAQK